MTAPATLPLARKLVLLLASTLMVMTGAALSPGLPAIEDHFAGTPGADFLVRLVLTAPALAIAVFAPLAGAVIDRLGRVRVLGGATLAYALAGGAGLVVGDLESLIASRLALGIAAGAIVTTTTTLIGDYYGGFERSRMLGWQATGMGLSGVVFLLVGGALATYHWRAPFALYLAAGALIPFMVRILAEPHRTEPAGQSPAPAALPLRRAGPLFAAAFVVMLGFYLVPTQLPFLLHELTGAQPAGIGPVMALMALVSAGVAANYGRIRASLDHARILALGLGLIAAAFALIAAAQGYVMVALAMPLVGAGMGLNIPNLNLWLIATVPRPWRGRAMGGMTASLFLGQFLSPIGAHPVVAHAGPAGAFGVGAVVFGLAALASLAVARRGGTA